MRFRFLILIWVSLLLTVCSVIGQTRKGKMLTEADYHLWSTLNTESISDYGKWVSYSLTYESGLDTLFVKGTGIGKTFVFAKGSGGKFIGEQRFGCMLPEQKFRLTNLTSGKAKAIEGVQEFVVADNGKYIILYCQDNALVVLNLEGEAIDRIEHVSLYTMNPKGDGLGYCVSDANGGSVGLLSFGKILSKKTVTIGQGRTFQNLTWQPNGKSVAFVRRAVGTDVFSGDAILYYRLVDQKLFQYDTTIALNWPKDMIMDASYVGNLEISDDGKRVYFKTQMKRNLLKVTAASDVQIWSVADKDLYSFRESFGNNSIAPWLAGWLPDSGQFFTVDDDDHPSTILSGDQNITLVYNDIKPTWKQVADRDYYLRNLETGAQNLFLKGQSGVIGQLSFSPNGKYILYFRDRNWWVYSITEKTHINITKNNPVSFYDVNLDQSEDPQGFGCGGWYSNDGSLLLYDEFDIWRYNPDGLVANRLTKGREHNQIYRVVSKKKSFEVDEDLILHVKTIDNSYSGYSVLDTKDVVKPIVYENKLVIGLRKAKYTNSFIFTQEDFNEPRSLLYTTKVTKPKKLFKSNLQHYQFGWGKSELITYQNSKEAVLNGVLCYPFDYNPKQFYPMIVYVYQRQTMQLHTYTNPTLLNGAGLNPSNFTSKGYFVLYPDISYEIGNPGISAIDCVLAATNKAVTIASVDKSKIGLMGHSFGGYQTDFIITQTHLFAAAIAGSAITDMQSSYLSENNNEKNCNSWRYEYQQFRMGKPLFEDYEGYYRNSPIRGVSKITTPLFSYTGIGDTQVNPYQTMEFYLALRRLQKEHIMILYPNENHAVLGREHQIDLTKRFTEWFGYYLKGQPKPDWFRAQ